jgi:hypothetical protein
MPKIKSDIRLIDGDISAVVETIKDYLPSVGYKFNYQEITGNGTSIKATNLQQSIIRLYLANHPQIVHFHLGEKTDGQVKIEIKFDLFPKFRAFFYSVILILLFGFIAVLTFDTWEMNSIRSLTAWKTYQPSNLAIIISLTCFVAACGFYTRSISMYAYENFIDKFYGLLHNRFSSNKTDIQTGHSFPDLWNALYLMGIFTLLIFFSFRMDTLLWDNTLTSLFFKMVLFVLGLFCILLLLMILQPQISPRVFFLLAGFSISIPIVFYISPPIILSFTGNLSQLFKDRVNAGYPIEVINYASISYLAGFALMVLLGTIILLSYLYLPVRLVMQLDKYSALNPLSRFNRSFRSENPFFIFHFTLIFLWGMIGFVKLWGLYFVFTILEKLFWGTNHIFCSDTTILFYENTEICILNLFESKFNPDLVLSLHRIFMFLHCIPMLAFLVLIINKNIKSSIAEYSLTKPSPDGHAVIERRLSSKIKDICEFVGIRVPIVRVFDSGKINASTKFIGFPVFKNFLLLSTGAWEELKDKKTELDLLLAHEIFHMKRHNFWRRMLRVLSDYSLFGNGFLTLLQNPFHMEREADNFAVEWIASKYQDNSAASSMKSLFECVEETNWRNAVFQTTGSVNFSSFADASSRRGFLSMFHESTRYQKIKINLKLFFQIYFGEEIQSYFHPSNNQRIAWAEEHHGTTDTK